MTHRLRLALAPFSRFLASATLVVFLCPSLVHAVTYAITPNPKSVSESAGSFAFTITRSGGTPAETIYASTTTTEGYSNGSDYTGIANQSVTFTSGQASKTVTVTINDDSSVETSETFGFIVQRNTSDPVSTYLAKSTFTITDNDVLSTTYAITPNPATVAEGAGTLTFTITRSGGTPAETIYASTMQSEGSVNNSDYTGVSNQVVSFTSGQLTRTVTVTINDDSTVETSETFALIVQRNANDLPSVYLAKSTFTITDNDASTTYAIMPNPATVDEGTGTLTFTITRSGGTPAETIYASTIQSEGSVNNSDYTGVSNQVVSFTSGQLTRTVTVAILNDTTVENNEMFALIVQRNANDLPSVYLAKSTFTINDNDATGVTLSLTSPNGGESVQAGTSLPIFWTVSGYSAVVSSFRIAYSLDGGATWGVAHSYVPGSARSINWTTPASASSSQCSLTILAFNGAGDVIHLDTSDANFSIAAPGSRPVAVPDCNNNAPAYGQSVRFDGGRSSASAGRSIVSYLWSFGDDETASGETPYHSYTPVGQRTYTVTLTVTDSAGDVSYPNTMLVTVTGQALGPNTPQSKSDDPVNLATGNFLYDHTDLTIPGIGFPFTFQRFYNSKDTGNLDGPMGAYWSHSYATRISTSNGMVRVTFGDGRSEIYTNSAGVYVSEPGIYNTLSTNTNGTFALTTKEQTRYNFDALGRLAAIVDKNSNTLSLLYGGSGALAAATNSAGRVISFVNDASNRIIRIVAPLSRTNSFAYSEQGDLISATDPRGGVTRYGYDAEHQMTNAIDPNGNQFVRNVYNNNRVVECQKDALGFTTTFTYDFATRETIVTNALGYRQVHKHDDSLRVIQIMDEAGNIQNFEYDEFNNRTKVVDKNRRATTYTYDARGNVTSKTDPSGNVITIGYDLLNNATNRVDAKLGSTVFIFDGKGNLTKTVNSQNFTNTVTYSAKGLPLLIRDAKGNTLSNSFDTAGNLLLTRDALGFTRRYSYDIAGRKLTEVDPNNATNRFSYDANNNLIAAVDPLRLTNSFAYDPNGNQILIKDARGNQTVKVYDAKDRLVSVSNALGSVTFNTYDALDRRIATTDALGNETRFFYDPVGNLDSVSNALGQVTRYSYDPSGNQLTVVNPLGQVMTNSYDMLNRLVATADPLDHTTRYAYDELGRRTEVTDANAQVTRMRYDILGRLTNVIDAATGTVHFAYDKVGNRTAMIEPNWRTTAYTYDAINRLIQKQEPIGTYQYRYDGAGNRIGITDAMGNSITNTFDANHRLTAVRYPGGSQVTFAYDANGNLIRMTDSLGTSTYTFDAMNRMTNYTDSAGNTVAYTYDANDNRLSIAYPGNKVVNYTYDDLNRMTSVTDWLGGVTTYAYDAAGNLVHASNPNGTTVRYGFDDAGRLISLTNALPDASAIAAYTLTLDGVGNHLQTAQIDPIEPLIPPQAVSYSYDTDNRLTNATGTAFSYDLNGNMIEKGADTFSFDYENRLTQAVVSGVTHQYQYDGVGNRLSGTRDGVTTRYMLDVNGTLAHVLAEADAGGTITAYYVYGRGLVSRITAGNTAAYYHYDVRGSTVAMTDSAGNITDKYAYDPFGTVANSAGVTPNPFKYVGRYGVMDEGNGLAYIRARYYSPVLGRFVTKDPVTGTDGDSQSLNRYIYALNNPLTLIDASGYSARSVMWGIGQIAAGIGGTVLASAEVALSVVVPDPSFTLFTISANSWINSVNDGSKLYQAAWDNIVHGGDTVASMDDYESMIDRGLDQNPMLKTANVGLSVAGLIHGMNAFSKADSIADAIDVLKDTRFSDITKLFAAYQGYSSIEGVLSMPFRMNSVVRSVSDLIADLTRRNQPVISEALEATFSITVPSKKH